MINTRIGWVCFWLCLLALPTWAQQVRVAVAASLMPPMKALTEAFAKKQSAIRVELSAGSSGKLTAQIEQGAPFHLFFSADTVYPQQLANKGKTIGKPRVWGKGALVLWAAQPIAAGQVGARLQAAGGKIALAQPELAPYGQAAVDWLQRKGYWSAVKSRVVYGESIGQVNQYIYSGAVALAFTSLSSMKSAELRQKGYWLSDLGFPLIPQGLVQLRYGSEQERQAAARFVQFATSAEAAAIWREFGYEIGGK